MRTSITARTTKKLAPVAAAAFLALGMTACDDTDGGGEAPPAEEPAPEDPMQPEEPVE